MKTIYLKTFLTAIIFAVWSVGLADALGQKIIGFDLGVEFALI